MKLSRKFADSAMEDFEQMNGRPIPLSVTNLLLMIIAKVLLAIYFTLNEE